MLPSRQRSREGRSALAKSMTGYGRCSELIGAYDISAEIRSVNHKFFEFSCKYPRQYGFLEEKIKSAVAKKVSRGKVEVFIGVQEMQSTGVSVSADLPLAKAYSDALAQIADTCGTQGGISAETIARMPDVLKVIKQDVDEDVLTAAVLTVLEKAVGSFSQMRVREGDSLKSDVLEKCGLILDSVAFIEGRSEESVKAYRARLEAKIKELLSDTSVDEQRLLTETAIFADKIAVDEETVRLKSHISQIKSLLSADEPIGRKLDFIVQEMNRETNTIGSKCNDYEISKKVIDMKSIIEKIREQIQNIE